MTPKTLKLSAAAAIVVVVLALVVVRRDVSATAPETAAGPLFPDLQTQLDDAASIAVTSKDGAFEIGRNADGGWGLSDKGGYPVDVDKVHELLLGVSGFETIEAKTKNPAKHSALGLAAPDDPEAEAILVEVRDAEGAGLASVVLGRLRPYRGTGARSMYVRRAGEDQSWEVTGDLRVDGVATNWLDKEILKVEALRIRGVAIDHPGGERLAVAKETADAANFEVADFPADAELAWPGAPNAVANALNYLNLEDVKPSTEVDFTTDPGAKAVFTCWDGLVVHVETTEHEDKTFARFTASFDESSRVEPVGPPPPADGEEAADAEPPAEPAEPAMASVEEVRAEVDELNAKLQRWAYGLPSWTAQNFAKRLDDLLKKEAVEEEPVEVGNLEELEQLGIELPAGDPADEVVLPEVVLPEVVEPEVVEPDAEGAPASRPVEDAPGADGDG